MKEREHMGGLQLGSYASITEAGSAARPLEPRWYCKEKRIGYLKPEPERDMSMKLLRIESELESIREECLMVVPDEYKLEIVYDAVEHVLPEPTVVEVIELSIGGRFHLYRPYFG